MSALTEELGGSVEATPAGGVYRLGFGFSGSPRFYVVSPTAPGTTVQLPVALLMPTPAELVVANRGSSSFSVVYSIIGTTLVTVAPGQEATLTLLNSLAPWGVWFAKVRSIQSGTALAARLPITIEIGPSITGPVDLRRMAIDMGTGGGTLPYAVRCNVRSGAMIGASSTSTAAIQTGQWPAGSTLLLNIEAGAIITGMGGAGGRGGDIPPGLLSQAGGDGGPAIAIEMNATIVNRGRIQGGGGGGGGAARVGGQAGGGGGGGAGAARSLGAAGGSPNGQAGGDGSVNLPGVGGGLSTGTNGGDGGFPGGTGSFGNGGAAGGAAGYGVLRFAAYSYSYIANPGSFLAGGTLVL